MSGPSRPRLLLVHANPFQQVAPVPPYGLERLRTAVSDIAEVEVIDPFLTAADPFEAAAAAAVSFRPDLIGLGIRVIEDCIVIDSAEGPDDTLDITSFLTQIRMLRDALGRAAPQTPLVAGGAAFSYLPAELLAYLQIDYGVVGAGEAPLRQLVSRLAAGDERWRETSGLLRRGGPKPAVGLSFGSADRLSTYGILNGIPVRTRIGCAMQCSYCLTANIGRRHETAPLEQVLDEAQAAVEEAQRRGYPAPLFFADDEFNLPDVEHAIDVLEGLLARGLKGKFSWRAYFNPTPFPERLAVLARQTGGHVSLTVDSAADAVLARNGKPFRRRHLEQTIELLAREQVSTDLGMIFGLPGEDFDTLADSIGFLRRLPPAIEACYSSGARVYPHTPLERLALADPGGLLGDPTRPLEPLAYARPLPPRPLARWLGERLSDRANVYLVGVGFARASQAQGLAYRALAAADGGRAEWQEALTAAASGAYLLKGSRLLERLSYLADWNERPDLAALALERRLQLPRVQDDGGRWLARLELWNHRRQARRAPTASAAPPERSARSAKPVRPRRPGSTLRR